MKTAQQRIAAAVARGEFTEAEASALREIETRNAADPEWRRANDLAEINARLTEIERDTLDKA